MALLQPAPEVFDIFDNVLLLCDGAPPLRCLPVWPSIVAVVVEPRHAAAAELHARLHLCVLAHSKHPACARVIRLPVCTDPGRSSKLPGCLHDLHALKVLHAGHVVYHGPRESCMGFFNQQGFQLPARKGVADFLQEVTSLKVCRPPASGPTLAPVLLVCCIL